MLRVIVFLCLRELFEISFSLVPSISRYRYKYITIIWELNRIIY